jgi:hypothetical protein
MTDASLSERLDELQELEAHLDAGLSGVREERARLEASMTSAEKWARAEVERRNPDLVVAERARLEAELDEDRELTITIGKHRTLRATLRDPRRERELADLQRAGLITATGHFAFIPPLYGETDSEAA